MSEDLYIKLVYFLGAEQITISGKDQAMTPCPYCGVISTRSDFRCSFGAIFPNGGLGFKCFSCHTVKALVSMAYDVGLLSGSQYQRVTIPKRPKPQPKKSYAWIGQERRFLDKYINADGRYKAWYDYKRLPPEIVDKYRLGLGVLPSVRCNHKRLITPIFDHQGKPKLFRGRKTDCDCNSWLGSAGRSPYDLPLILGRKIPPRSVIFVVENYVDAVMVNSLGYHAVCTLSTGYWCDLWTEQLKSKNPRAVIVTFDADLAGNGAITKAQLIKTAKKRISAVNKIDIKSIQISHIQETENGWVVYWGTGITSGRLTIPMPSGVKLTNRLIDRGINAQLGRWVRGEENTDIGAELVKEIDLGLISLRADPQ